MYIEASDIEPGSVAVLTTPPLDSLSRSTSGLCLTFWYNMYGQHIGTLNVSVSEPSGISKIVWTKQDNQSCKIQLAKSSYLIEFTVCDVLTYILNMYFKN